MKERIFNILINGNLRNKHNSCNELILYPSAFFFSFLSLDFMNDLLLKKGQDELCVLAINHLEISG